MKKAAKYLSLMLCLLTACKNKPVSTDDPKLKAMVDSIVRVRVEKYVQIVMHQYILQQQQGNSANSSYRRIAREEAERAAGRAAQEHQSLQDAVLNAQGGY